MKLLTFGLIISLLSISCGVYIPLKQNKGKLNYLEIGQTKNEVRSNMGNPHEVRGGRINEEGEVINVWQYNLYNKNVAWINMGLGFFPLFTTTWWVPNLTTISQPQSYFLYFTGDQKILYQWGRPQDWKDETKKIKQDIKLEVKDK